jgi:hypothetical protein
MRVPLAALSVATLVLVATGCAGPRGTSATESSGAGMFGGPSPVRDVGDDKDGDNDNERVRKRGRSVSATERQAIEAVVKRYYAAAADDDGPTACWLIYRTFAKAIPEEYGRPSGPPGLRGNTCATVMTKLFREEHARLVADLDATVTDIRATAGTAVVLLYYNNTKPEHTTSVQLEGSVWKISTLIDNKLA